MPKEIKKTRLKYGGGDDDCDEDYANGEFCDNLLDEIVIGAESDDWDNYISIDYVYYSESASSSFDNFDPFWQYEEENNGGGGSSGNTDTNSSPDQIINNFKDKADCVYGKMDDNSILSKTLEEFNDKKNKRAPVHLILNDKSNLRDSKGKLINGQTEYGLSYYITITLNTEQSINRPSLAVARTILHEAIHAEIYRKIKMTEALVYDYKTQEYKLKDGSRPNFPSLFDSWNDHPENPYHNYMAGYYRDAIEVGLREYAKTIGETHSDKFYKDMAWNGLLDTKVWDKQYKDKVYADKEKDRIKKVISNFEKSGNNECK